MLFSRLIQEFSSYGFTERGVSEATIAVCRSTLSRLSDFLAGRGSTAEFETVRTANLRRFVSDIKQTRASNATIARHVHAVRSFWRFVVETYDLGSNTGLPRFCSRSGAKPLGDPAMGAARGDLQRR